MRNDNQSFMDSKTILAVVFVAAAWMGWQWHISKKYPQPTKIVAEPKAEEQSASAATKVTQTPEPINNTTATAANSEKKDEIAEAAPAAENLLNYEDENMSFSVSSKGMGLKNIFLKKYTDRDGKPIDFKAPEKGALPYETGLLGHKQPLDFVIEKVGEHRILGRAKFGGLEITKTIEIDTEKYLLDTRVSVDGQADNFLGLSTFVVENIRSYPKASFFAPTYEIQEFYISSKGGTERVVVEPGKPMTKSVEKFNVISLGTHYFTQALLDRSTVVPELKLIVDNDTNQASALINHMVLNRTNKFEVSYLAFIGPKNLQLLKSIDENLAGIVNFGFFSFLARPILSMMKWFYSQVGNWGLAIIILTIVVRLLVLPFNIMSYKSMKSMQKIQPQLKALREKYKDDQKRLNEEMMVLMKTNKVNPLGGCLPLLLQFPVFLALYQVLGQSIELYKAPFGFWIIDLSLKDPFYVLPVLMGITMYVQQKITPNTMDPAQAKIMMFMPVFFSFLMVSLPSGLTLYIFISSLFAVAQQLYFMRQTEAVRPT